MKKETRIIGYSKGLGIHARLIDKIRNAEADGAIWSVSHFLKNLNERTLNTEGQYFDFYESDIIEGDKLYLLVGEDAIRAFEKAEDGLKAYAAYKQISDYSAGALIKWDSSMPATKLLEEIMGWNDYKILSPKTFESIANGGDKPKLLASKFVEWYFEDGYEWSELFNSAVGTMKKKGVYSVSVEDLFKNCTVIPECICEGYDKELGEAECSQFTPSIIDFINDIQK